MIVYRRILHAIKCVHSTVCGMFHKLHNTGMFNAETALKRCNASCLFQTHFAVISYFNLLHPVGGQCLQCTVYETVQFSTSGFLCRDILIPSYSTFLSLFNMNPFALLSFCLRAQVLQSILVGFCLLSNRLYFNFKICCRM